MPSIHLCPRCGSRSFWFTNRGTRKCRRCRRESSIRTAYPVPGFRLTRTDWHRAIEAFLSHRRVRAVEARCRIAHQTATAVVRRIRETMTADVPELLAGTCEADETYVGGAWRNKAVHIRRQGTKRGRGTSKQAIFGLVQRQPQRVRVWLVPDTQRATLLPVLASTVIRGSTVYTDGLAVYRILPQLGYLHAWVEHDRGEYVRGPVHTQTLDGYWGLLKNHLAATGGIRKRFLPLFIGEHVWRYNHRTLPLREQVHRLYRQITFGGLS